MLPAPGADLGALPAEQAPPPGQAQLLPLHLAAVRPQHIHIEQPPDGRMILQLRRNGLDGQRLGIHQQNTLVARLLPDLFKIGNRHARNVQLPQQQPLPEVIAAADQGAVFDGARNVHREADHRPPASQQLPLPPDPLLPGLQHFRQRYFHGFLLHLCLRKHTTHHTRFSSICEVVFAPANIFYENTPCG